MFSRKNGIELFGWYGVMAIVLAYILVSFALISATSWLYQLLNLTGAIGIMVDAISKKDRQPAVLNIFWAIIALVALGRLMIGL